MRLKFQKNGVSIISNSSKHQVTLIGTVKKTTKTTSDLRVLIPANYCEDCEYLTEVEPGLFKLI